MKSILLELSISLARKMVIWSALWLQYLLKKRSSEQIKKIEQGRGL